MPVAFSDKPTAVSTIMETGLCPKDLGWGIKGEAIGGGEGVCFLFVDEAKTWDDARVSCKGKGGVLATFYSGFEADRIFHSVDKKYGRRLWWIGLKYNEDGKIFWCQYL